MFFFNWIKNDFRIFIMCGRSWYAQEKKKIFLKVD